MSTVLFIDVETTGLDPHYNQVLEIAAIPVVDGLILPSHLHFEMLVKHPAVEVSQGVASRPEFLATVGRAATKGEDPDVVLQRFEEYLASRTSPGKYVPGGKNFLGFDRPFLHSFGIDVEGWFTHRAVDIGNLYLRPKDKEIPSLEECWRRGVFTFPVDSPQWHTAYGDALACALLYCSWYARNK